MYIILKRKEFIKSYETCVIIYKTNTETISLDMHT